MRRGGPLRLFVAVYPPAGVVEAALARLGALALPVHRPTPPGQIHLTLQFIGEVPAGKVGEVVESVTRSASGIEPLVLTARRIISLPGRGVARVVALETDAPPALLELQRRLAHRLARPPRDRSGDRFLPHLTLARFPGAGVRGLAVNEPADLGSFPINRVSVMSSVLSAAGASHREELGIDLGPPREPPQL